jgi:hypothetical protein
MKPVSKTAKLEAEIVIFMRYGIVRDMCVLVVCVTSFSELYCLNRGGGLPGQCSVALYGNAAAGIGPNTALGMSWGIPLFKLYPTSHPVKPNIDNSCRVPQCACILWPAHQGLLAHQGMHICSLYVLRQPLWSSGQSSWLQTQRTRVWFLVLPDFLRSSGSGTGSTQPREDNWGATWMEK